MANHIAEVAGLLGVKPGESFKIADDRNSFLKWERYYRFTNNGVEMSKDEIHWEKCMSEVLEWLIRGEIDIKLPWKPDMHGSYYSPLPTNEDLWGVTFGQVVSTILEDLSMVLSLKLRKKLSWQPRKCWQQ